MCKFTMTWLLILIFPLTSVAQNTIEIFTIKKIPALPNTNTKIYYIDTIKNLDDELNRQFENAYLLSGEKDAEKTAMNFINQHRAEYFLGLAAISKVYKYGIKKIPTIVINGKYQILGTVNAQNALEEINK